MNNLKEILSRFMFQFQNDWRQIGGKYKWYSFTFIYIYFEYEKITEGLEFWFVVLGVGFYIRYNLPKSDAIFKRYEEEIKRITK